MSSSSVQTAIRRLASQVNLDLLDIAYWNMGIDKPADFDLSGERYLIRTVLKNLISSPEPTCFDVGANVGEYSMELRREFPGASIYAFEPNSNAYDIAFKNLAPLNINCKNLGLAARKTMARIYSYANNRSSGHASIHKEAFVELYKTDDLIELEFETTTVDEFCAANEISVIDFIKIDTEGQEMEVLKGASKMISEKRISIIQFEFNTLHVYSRVFLRDFYELLHGYEIYRLDTDKLIPLFEYNPFNEIFRFQNIVAISTAIDSSLIHA
jgi:FkbM family methyltransferase